MSEAVYSSPKIIVGVDGSDNATCALRWAIDAAEARVAVVEAIYAWQFPALAYGSPGGYPPIDPRAMVDAAEQLVESKKESLDTGEVKVFTRCEEGYPTDVLRRAAEEPDVIAMVVGARGHSGVAGLVLGSVSHALTHHLTKPLVIVPPQWHPASKPSPVRIVVGVDGSENSARALAWAVAHAEPNRAFVEAVMVWPVPDPVLPVRVPLGAIEAADRHNSVEGKVLDFVRKAEKEGVQVRTLVLQGHPARTLLEQAKDADLLVVGTRGYGRAREFVSGSVSHSCTSHSRVPVAVIP